MSTITIFGSPIDPIQPGKTELKPELKPIEATTQNDGFTTTMLALREMGLDLKGIPLGKLRIVYNAGVAFAKTDKTTEAERLRTRNLMIWPVKEVK